MENMEDEIGLKSRKNSFQELPSPVPPSEESSARKKTPRRLRSEKQIQDAAEDTFPSDSASNPPDKIDLVQQVSTADDMEPLNYVENPLTEEQPASPSE